MCLVRLNSKRGGPVEPVNDLGSVQPRASCTHPVLYNKHVFFENKDIPFALVNDHLTSLYRPEERRLVKVDGKVTFYSGFALCGGFDHSGVAEACGMGATCRRRAARTVNGANCRGGGGLPSSAQRPRSVPLTRPASADGTRLCPKINLALMKTGGGGRR
ncbi:jg23870 [Pararge aegeria aegeria]|uniref:Jg23870 protein n=1 Tax=Pararge aegeria aegeria TaxID=348720 RepID=A0A8S4RR47_9NEOP|nr:jg23870 [Pararge aegeria aegeria]